MGLKKQKTVVTICLLVLIVTPALASAHGLVPCGGTGENPCNVQDIFVLVARLTNWLIAMAGIYAVYEIVNHGFWLIASMGNEESIALRKKAISNAVVGFVFVMMAYILINTAVNYFLLGSLPANSPLKVDLTNPFKYLTQ